MAAVFAARAREMPESEPDDGNLTLEEFWSDPHIKAAHTALGLVEPELADLRRAMSRDEPVLWGEYVIKAGRMIREVYRGKAVAYDDDWCSLSNAKKPNEHFWYCKRSLKSARERPAEPEYVLPNLHARAHVSMHLRHFPETNLLLLIPLCFVFAATMPRCRNSWSARIRQRLCTRPLSTTF